MGVKSCNRKDCENIMCRHYSRDFGYICDDCLGELQELATKEFDIFVNSPKTFIRNFFFSIPKGEELIDKEKIVSEVLENIWCE